MSRIDPVSHAATATASIGPGPSSLAVADDGTVLVAQRASGRLHLLHGATLAPIASLDLGAGISTVAPVPATRWVLVANPERDEVSVVDLAGGRRAYLLPVAGAPDEILISGEVAYIRLGSRDELRTLSIADLAGPSAPALASVAYGERAKGDPGPPPRPGALATSVREAGVLVADPGTGSVHLAAIGATGASGSFAVRGQAPISIRVVDRGFVEEADGVYSARFRVPEQGAYDVAVLLGAGEVAHCFRFDATLPDDAAEPVQAVLQLEEQPTNAIPGQPLRIGFRLLDGSGTAITDAEGIQLTAAEAGGNWSTVATSRALGGGRYDVDVTLPRAGVYRLTFTTGGLGVASPPSLFVRATQ